MITDFAERNSMDLKDLKMGQPFILDARNKDRLKETVIYMRAYNPNHPDSVAVIIHDPNGNRFGQMMPKIINLESRVCPINRELVLKLVPNEKIERALKGELPVQILQRVIKEWQASKADKPAIKAVADALTPLFEKGGALTMADIMDELESRRRHLEEQLQLCLELHKIFKNHHQC